MESNKGNHSRKFLFLYPTQRIFDWEIENGAYPNSIATFRKKYFSMFNSCIDLRYRQKDFVVNWAVFDDSDFCEDVEVQRGDVVFNVGMTEKEHYLRKVYPSSGLIIDLLGDVNELVVGGFHTYDCCARVAAEAYSRGIDVLVDEEVGERFHWFVDEPILDLGNYPGCILSDETISFRRFNPEMGCPWFYDWSEYQLADDAQDKN